MNTRTKAKCLFQYISEAYAIDLPVIRNINEYRGQLWWQGDIVSSDQCQIKQFDFGNDDPESEQQAESEGGAWLRVSKRLFDNPPSLPSVLLEWVELFPNPTKRPIPKPGILQRVSFEDDPNRQTLFNDYLRHWQEYQNHQSDAQPMLLEDLVGWVEEATGIDQIPEPIPEREIERKFEEEPKRVQAFEEYIQKQWEPWANRVLPLFKSNILYDEMFNLYAQLSVEGDRIEILWGHLFLSWDNAPDISIFHPLILTPLNLDFDPKRRTMSLNPSSQPEMTVDCLRELPYPNKDKLFEYVQVFNSDKTELDPWNHKQLNGFASTITGLLSNEPAEESNQHQESMFVRPKLTPHPRVFNAPLIFVRNRVRHFWIEDAKQVVASIEEGKEISPFIRSLIGEHKNFELEEELGETAAPKFDDEGELYFPLAFNEQQKDIWDKLNHRFGVLVQGPPGTGKSHTIANIVSSLLARGKRVLITSQTENALRVLRDLIPPEIRQLCVSQLGDDKNSKKELNEAVNAIGQRLAEQDNSGAEKRVQELNREIRKCRETQANLQHQIKDWVQLDSCKIRVGGAEISAHEAAKECAANQIAHNWFPDIIPPETEPVLVDSELREMAGLLNEIPEQDRKTCLLPLPRLGQLPTPEGFIETLSQLHTLSLRIEESEESQALRTEWGRTFNTPSQNQIETAIDAIETSLLNLQDLQEDWQLRILDLIATDEGQSDIWHDRLEALTKLYDHAFQSSRIMEGFEIQIENLPDNFDWEVALDELERLIDIGKDPSKWYSRFRLSKLAKHLFDSATVDGRNLTTRKRINAVRARFTYTASLNKFELSWEQAFNPVNGSLKNKDSSLPLVDSNGRLKSFRSVVVWADTCLIQTREVLQNLGCASMTQGMHREEVLTKWLKALHSQLAIIEAEAIEQTLKEVQLFLAGELPENNPHQLWTKISQAVESKDSSNYRNLYKEIERLNAIIQKAKKLENLLEKLMAVAPKWARELEGEASRLGTEAVKANWGFAWRWAQLNQWLNTLHSRESVDQLQQKFDRERTKEHTLVVRLVSERTWQRQIEKVKPVAYTALTAWANAMKLLGKGTGKHASRYLAAAATAMVDAVNAVPVWIMPLFRVVQSFKVNPGLFDVVIVDEASQCDIRSLPVLYRGTKVLVVGDPEQISPSNVGIPQDKVFELSRQLLTDIPHPERFDINNSLYAITSTIPGMDRTLLTEHFRCVPSIIEFNNQLCPSYGGNLEPLRQPNPREMLNPPIVPIFVETGFKDNNDVNKPEAERLVKELVRCCKAEAYESGGKNNRKRTMGVISLLGEKQAQFIHTLIAQELDETERNERQIICGDAYAFQGDERDVMFLSLVIASNSTFTAQVRDSARQRFNVATSRARDQVFLFHSVKLGEIRNPGCVRYKLLDWYLTPPKAELEAGLENLRNKAESPFEFEVGERVIKKGYKVIPQFRPFMRDTRYRIDLVVQGPKSRVAIECDGDRWHGPEKWESDTRREAQLRRAGWKFWRINGSAFYRDKEGSLESLWEFLEAEIKPIVETSEPQNIFPVGSTVDTPEETLKNEEKPSNESPADKPEEAPSVTETTIKVEKPGESHATRENVFDPDPASLNQEESDREKEIAQAVKDLSKDFSPGQRAFEIKVHESIVPELVRRLGERGIKPKIQQAVGQEVKVRVENPKYQS